ncbi:MAG: hypothetical protein A4E26_00739 [Methanobacterium sp. PtaU1.Bin097]|nr:MAG: hypothetical protein A4E26_00739 [Methanobacterium sp. PtaU1.Bin097]
MRQEDLQKILLKVSPNNISIYNMIYNFKDWCDGGEYAVEIFLIANRTKDITICWLAFVMETRYQKRWDAEKKMWVSR